MIRRNLILLLASWILAGILFDALFLFDLFGLLKIVLFFPHQGEEQANANLSRMFLLLLPATTILALAMCLAARAVLRRASLVIAWSAEILALALAFSAHLWVSYLALRTARPSLSFLVAAAVFQLVYLALFAGIARLLWAIRQRLSTG